MSSNGWIKLHRKIRENEIWQKEPFNKRSAWIDLLLRASHKGEKFLIGNTIIELEAGQIFTSEKKLADDWKWSRWKVRCFLNLLKEIGQIETPEKTSRYTILTITNWELYQSSNSNKATKKDIKKTSKRHQKDTYKNVKKVKNVKNSTNTIPQTETLISQFPTDIRSLVKEYTDIARLQNKTERMSLRKEYRLTNELHFLWSQYEGNRTDEADFRQALKTTVSNEAPNINYVRKVIQGIIKKRSVRMKRGIIST